MVKALYLEEVLEHASLAVGVLPMLHTGNDLVQGVPHAGVVLAKAQRVDGVADIKMCGLEGHQVVHMHRPLLEGLSRRKMEIASHLQMPSQHVKSSAAHHHHH